MADSDGHSRYWPACQDLDRTPDQHHTWAVKYLYGAAFRAAFGDESATDARIVQAIKEYVACLRTTESPFDRYSGGDDSALSASAMRGLALFRGGVQMLEPSGGVTRAQGCRRQPVRVRVFIGHSPIFTPANPAHHSSGPSPVGGPTGSTRRLEPGTPGRVAHPHPARLPQSGSTHRRPPPAQIASPPNGGLPGRPQHHEFGATARMGRRMSSIGHGRYRTRGN